MYNSQRRTTTKIWTLCSFDHACLPSFLPSFEAHALLLRMMTGWPDAKVTFPVLCLLRLLVLKRDANQFYASQFLVVKDPSGSGPSDNILRLVVDRLALPADGGGYSGKAPLLMA